MSDMVNKSLINNVKDLFSNLSNSSYYDHDFLEKKNSRLYQQLNLLLENSISDRNLLHSSSKVNNQIKNNFSPDFNSVDIDVIANKKAESMKDTLRFDYYTPGEISKTQLLFESMYKDNPIVFKEAYQKCWLGLYRNNDVENIIKFISISSDIDYSLLQERADSLIIAGYGHIDPFVMEAAIRAIEKWQQKHLVDYLKNMRPSEIEWIEQYKFEVIEDLSLIL